MFLSYGSQLCVPINPLELTVTYRGKIILMQKLHQPFLYYLTLLLLPGFSYEFGPYQYI